jgi:DNA polymerase-3 subunit delta'
MSFENIIGQKKAVEILNKYAATSPPQALLFTGPDGAGRAYAALEFARALNCENGHTSPSDCQCRSCRAVAESSHPAVIYVDAEYQRQILGRDVKEFSIDTVRAIQKALSLKLSYGRKAVVIVTEARKLSDEAANSFLKTLEEPSSAAVLILICRSKKEMPRTIVSRCQSVFFAALSDEDVEGILKRLRPDCASASAIARASAGSVSRALLFEEKADRYRELKKKFERLELGEFKDEDIGGFLDYLAAVFRAGFTAAPLENLFRIEALHDARRLAAEGVNKNMVLTNLHARLRAAG